MSAITAIFHAAHFARLHVGQEGGFFCKKSNLRHLYLHAMQHNVYITTHTCPCMLWIHPWIICNQGPHGHWAVTLCECAASSLAEGNFPWRPLGWGWSPKPKRIASACLWVAQVQSLVWRRPPQDIWGSATQNKTKQNKTSTAPRTTDVTPDAKQAHAAFLRRRPLLPMHIRSFILFSIHVCLGACWAHGSPGLGEGRFHTEHPRPLIRTC